MGKWDERRVPDITPTSGGPRCPLSTHAPHLHRVAGAISQSRHLVHRICSDSLKEHLPTSRVPCPGARSRLLYDDPLNPSRASGVVRRGRGCGPDSSVIENQFSHSATRKRAAGTSSSTITAFRDLTASNSPRDWLFSTCNADLHPSCPWWPGRLAGSGWLSIYYKRLSEPPSLPALLSLFPSLPSGVPSHLSPARPSLRSCILTTPSYYEPNVVDTTRVATHSSLLCHTLSCFLL